MSWLLSKRIKRSSRSRCLRRGLERLELRNLLAADVVPEESASLPETETYSDEALVEVALNLDDIEVTAAAFTCKEVGDTQEDEPKLEQEIFADEQPELGLGSSSEESLEPSSEELELTGDALVEEDFIEFLDSDSDPLLDESICFMSMSGGFEFGDPTEAELFDGEVFDADQILYTLSFGTSGDMDEEDLLERVPGDDTVKLELDEVSDGGEIRTFGGSGPEDAGIFATGGVTFMSDWYNSDNPLDANLDGETTAIDALIVFNSLTYLGSVQLSHAVFARGSLAEAFDLDTNFRVDGNNDGYLSPLDGLLRLNFFNEADELADSALDQVASILPGEWDQYESADQIELDESLPSEDSGDDQSTEVFGARIRNPDADWPEDELNDTAADDEFWSKFAGDASDTLLDEEMLDILARS